MTDLAAWAPLTYEVFKDLLRMRSKYVKSPKKYEIEQISSHITEIEKWSSSINMFGLARPLELETNSIAISVTTQPRKFFTRESKKQTIKEENLCDAEKSYVILGDPGAGKTTIVKRLARKLIINESISEVDNFQFPMLVLGRDVKQGDTLFSIIFDKLGFDFNDEFENNNWKNKAEQQAARENLRRNFVIKALKNKDVIIFVDGLDEIDTSLRLIFEKDISDLSKNLIRGSVIITCRSGDWNRNIDNFYIVEMMPLSNEEIKQIVDLWADDASRFLSAVDGLPYKEILDRPLFLTMLIMVFNQTGDLPDTPVDVYHRVTNLLVDRWDTQRGVRRNSRYDGFLSEKKFKFLCAVAYHLARDIGGTRFNSNTLQQAISLVAPKFGLPSNEWNYIRQEIESHTGIIVESGFENFEFCHLTVQEFLTASHLVTIHGESEVYQMLTRSPESVAVAVCLSGSRSDFLAGIVGNIASRMIGKNGVELAIDVARPFFRRLHMESPVLWGDVHLMNSLLIIMHVMREGSSRIGRDDQDFCRVRELIMGVGNFDIALVEAKKSWRHRNLGGGLVSVEISRASSYGISRLMITSEDSRLLRLG